MLQQYQTLKMKGFKLISQPTQQQYNIPNLIPLQAILEKNEVYADSIVSLKRRV